MNPTPESHISADIEKNYRLFSSIFSKDDTVIFRRFTNEHCSGIQFFAISINGMSQGQAVYQSVVHPLMHKQFLNAADPVHEAYNGGITNIDLKCVSTVDKVVEAIVYGDTAVFVSGSTEVLIADTKGFKTRSVDEPDEEKSLKGPREGFTESIITNLSLIRRKLQTPDLKMEFSKAGQRTNTRICLVYLDTLVDKKVLTDISRRLDKISIDGILDANYIAELISGHRYSPFKTVGTTEKPDIVASRLLEGRVALVVDGTPMVLTVPYLFVESFQSPDDYYLGFYYASLGRVIRMLGFLVTISLPSVYLALVTFHQEMLPNSLMTAIVQASQGVPFPTLFECLIMLFTFEMLRETGIRMSSKIGQALGVVGGLVVGQAAVEAKIVSAPMVIVIAFTGMTGLLVPRLNSAAITVRTLALLSTAVLGFYGFFLFMSGVLMHILSLKSFSYDYISLSTKPQHLKDIYIRAPWWNMKTRPPIASDLIRERTRR